MVKRDEILQRDMLLPFPHARLLALPGCHFQLDHKIKQFSALWLTHYKLVVCHLDGFYLKDLLANPGVLFWNDSSSLQRAEGQEAMTACPGQQTENQTIWG